MPQYPVTPKENSRRIRVAIRRVFLDVWDPIGIGDEPNAQGKYDGYIGGMFDLLFADVPDADLNQYLIQVVAGMGMDGSRASHADVISALRAIDLIDRKD